MALEILEAHPAGGARPTPLLFVHGAWHGGWCWERMLPYVSGRGYHAYAPSLRGHGASGSSKSLRRTTLGDYVADVAEVAARLPAAPVIVGHSMGGLVAQKYLAGGGRAAACVLLASAPPQGVLGATLRIAGRHPLAFLEVNATLRLWPIVATPELARQALFSDSLSTDDVAALHRRLQDESFLAYLGMLLPRVDPRRVKVPVLVLGGEADRVFTATEVRATARAYGVEAEIIPGAAHDMMLDPTWEKTAARIVAWLGERGL